MTQATPALDARARAALATEFARALESPGLRPLPPRLTGALLPRFARYYDQLLHLPGAPGGAAVSDSHNSRRSSRSATRHRHVQSLCPDGRLATQALAQETV